MRVTFQDPNWDTGKPTGGKLNYGDFGSMFNAQSAFAHGLEMLDGAVCHFMGSGVATITKTDEQGRPQAATIGDDVMGAAVAAFKTDAGDGTVGSCSYRFTGGGAVAFTNLEEPDSSVVVTVEDLENALAAMVN